MVGEAERLAGAAQAGLGTVERVAHAQPAQALGRGPPGGALGGASEGEAGQPLGRGLQQQAPDLEGVGGDHVLQVRIGGDRRSPSASGWATPA